MKSFQKAPSPTFKGWSLLVFILVMSLPLMALAYTNLMPGVIITPATDGTGGSSSELMFPVLNFYGEETAPDASLPLSTRLNVLCHDYGMVLYIQSGGYSHICGPNGVLTAINSPGGIKVVPITVLSPVAGRGLQTYMANTPDVTVPVIITVPAQTEATLYLWDENTPEPSRVIRFSASNYAVTFPESRIYQATFGGPDEYDNQGTTYEVVIFDGGALQTAPNHLVVCVTACAHVSLDSRRLNPDTGTGAMVSVQYFPFATANNQALTNAPDPRPSVVMENVCEALALGKRWSNQSRWPLVDTWVLNHPGNLGNTLPERTSLRDALQNYHESTNSSFIVSLFRTLSRRYLSLTDQDLAERLPSCN